MCSESNAPSEITSKRIILIVRLFQVFSDVSFAAVYIPPKGVGGVVFTADSGDPLQVLHEAALGQREVCRLRLRLSETEKDPP